MKKHGSFLRTPLKMPAEKDPTVWDKSRAEMTLETICSLLELCGIEKDIETTLEDVGKSHAQIAYVNSLLKGESLPIRLHLGEGARIIATGGARLMLCFPLRYADRTIGVMAHGSFSHESDDSEGAISCPGLTLAKILDVTEFTREVITKLTEEEASLNECRGHVVFDDRSPNTATVYDQVACLS